MAWTSVGQAKGNLPKPRPTRNEKCASSENPSCAFGTYGKGVSYLLVMFCAIVRRWRYWSLVTGHWSLVTGAASGRWRSAFSNSARKRGMRNTLLRCSISRFRETIFPKPRKLEGSGSFCSGRLRGNGRPARWCRNYPAGRG